MNAYLKSGVALCSICLVIALALAGVNALTAPYIAEAEAQAVLEGLGKVYEGAKEFTPLNLDDYSGLPETVTEAYSVDDLGGYVVKLVTAGYSSDFVIMVGIDTAGAVKGAISISNTETPSIGGVQAEIYGSNFIGLTISDADSVDTVGGATRTTEAYKNAIKDALGTAMILGGGSYDARTDEEIKLDAALPEAEGGFETTFYAEYIEGLTAVYTAENAKGAVLVYGDTFVGLNAAGEVSNVIVGLSDDGEPIKNEAYDGSAASDYALIRGGVSEAIDYSSYGLSSYIDSIEKTASGNYIVVIRANGYDAQSSYSPTKKPIVIKVSVSASGKVICTETVEQNETDGVGSVCGSYEYYSKFNGKTAEDYASVDTVAGATVTTKAYRDAVGKVISAVNTIEAAESGEGGSANE